MPTVAILLQILVQYGPSAYAAAVTLFHHPDPTKDDFLKLLDSIAQEDYDTIIAERRAARGLGPAQGPVADPTTARYPTKDETITHVTPSWPNVLAYSDG